MREGEKRKGRAEEKKMQGTEAENKECEGEVGEREKKRGEGTWLEEEEDSLYNTMNT